MVTDEVEIAWRYAEYIYILHLKDFAPGSRCRFTCETITDECFSPSGTGEIRTKEILSMRKSFPNYCGKGIVAQNARTRDIFEDLAISYRSIRQMF